MATQLFLLDTVADTHLATNNNNLIPTAVGWIAKALGTARGSGVVSSASTATVTGPTLGVVVNVGLVAAEWISPPVSADVTISGTITANIWGRESANAANAAINVQIEIIRANATATANSNTLVTIVKSTRVTELGASASTNTAQNFTTGMTSGGYTGQTLNRGDRLRILVFADDVGTMGSGQTFTIGYNGTTATANGDTYVTFTENFSFEELPGILALERTDVFVTQNIGRSTGTSKQTGQPFVASSSTLAEVNAWVGKSGAPTDDLVIEVQTDSSGIPSGTVVGTVATIPAASLTTLPVLTSWSVSMALTASQTYWLVFRRSGAQSDTVYYQTNISNGTATGLAAHKFESGTSGGWFGSGSTAVTVRLEFSGGPNTVLYLTDTASDVATASVDREAWTSRGAGVQTDVRNTAAGWTAPLQVTDTAGGTVVDWFTKQLTAFTLTGKAVANIRALTSALSANVSLRCELARVDSDGTNATVWASWCLAPGPGGNGLVSTAGDLPAVSEGACTVNISGDDLAFSDGQRVRIRLYIEDVSDGALVTGQTATFYYAGTSGGASGDTYITLAQTVSEFVSSTPGPAAMYRQRRASRFLTHR